MISKTDAQIRAKMYLKNNRNAAKTIRELEPKTTLATSEVKGHRMLRSVQFKNALQEELESIGIDNDYKNKTLKSLTQQTKSPATQLETVKYLDDLVDRKPKQITHLHLHKD